MINYIITSSILILLVVLLRQLLKGKIMLRIQYAMWLLVLVRLLIPVQLGSSPLSIMNVASIIETSVSEHTNDDLLTNANSNANKNDSTVINKDSHVNKNDNTVTNVNTNKSDEAVLNNAESAVAGSQMSDGSTNQAIVENNIINSSENTNIAIKQDVGGKSINFDISTVILCGWIFGAVILGGILLVSNIIFRYRLIHTRKRLEISDYPLAVYISNEVPSSCLFGIFKPAVYLTEEAAANDEQRRFVLEHELTHFKHMDHVWSILRNLLLIVHWYNPLVWVAAVLSRRDAELACDEATISRLGDSARVEYGKALLELSQIKRRNAYLLSFSAASNKEDLKERINMLVYKPSMKKITAVVLALMLCVITACTFTGKNDNNQADTEREEISNEQFDTEGESDFETQEQQETEIQDVSSISKEEWEAGELPEIQTVELPEYRLNIDPEITKNLSFWTPDFSGAQDLNNEYWDYYIYSAYTSTDDYEYVDGGYVKVPEEDVKKDVRNHFGIELTDFYPERAEENGVFYEAGYYYVGCSDFPDKKYTIDDYQILGDVITVTFRVSGSNQCKIFTLEKTDNEIGFIIKSIEYKDVDSITNINSTSEYLYERYIEEIYRIQGNTGLDDNVTAYAVHDVDNDGYPELLIRQGSMEINGLGLNGNYEFFGECGGLYSRYYQNEDGGIILEERRGDNVKIYEINLEKVVHYYRVVTGTWNETHYEISSEELAQNGVEGYTPITYYESVQKEIYSGNIEGYTISGEPLQFCSIFDLSAIENYPWQ